MPPTQAAGQARHASPPIVALARPPGHAPDLRPWPWRAEASLTWVSDLDAPDAPDTPVPDSDVPKLGLPAADQLPAGTAPTDGMDPDELARQAAAVIAERTGVATHDIALVLGSGWGETADRIGETLTVIENTDVPGFRPAAVVGHSATMRSVAIGDTGRRALVYGTRTHFYEGLGVRAVVHGVRTAAAAGCRAIVLTNGCGGLRPEWSPGTPVLISDHLNLTATSPLEGATFVDLTDLYSPRLRALAKEIDPSLDEGVYVQFRGPHYETPAEVRMAGILGGDLVGMSTTLEAVAARHVGLEILGISLVTNPAAGISATPLSHAEVVEAGQAAAARCGELLARIVARI